MKKTLLFLGALLVTTTQAYAYTSIIDPDPTGFTVVDRHTSSDTWNTTYMGYYSTLSTVTNGYYTGYYLGTITSDPTSPSGKANDEPADLTSLMNYYLEQSKTYTFTKVDMPEGVTTPVSNGTLTVDCGTDCKSGTWSITGANVQFYSVKAANEYALYFVVPATNSGSWTTAHLLTPTGKNIPTISHMQAGTSPVPVPSTALLLGSSLIGLIGFSSKRRNQS